MPWVVSAENCGIRSCSADIGVDVPVVQVVDWVSAGGASNSVHRQSLWTFQYAQRQGAFSRVWRRCRVGPFRAPPGRPGVERQFSEPSMMKSSLSSRAPAQLAQRLWTYTFVSLQLVSKTTATATHNTQQHTATHSNTQQHTTTHNNTQ